MTEVHGTIKALEWTEPSKRTNGCWTAECVFGTFSVAFDDGWHAVLEDGISWDWEPENDPRTYDGPSAAMAACAAYYERRISAAIDTPDAAEPVAAGIEWSEGFKSPDIGSGDIESFIVLAEIAGERMVMPAYWLNAAPLLHEHCVCIDGEVHDPAEGCPATGWYFDHSNPEHEHCFYPVEGNVIAWASLPSAEQVANSLERRSG